MSRWEKVLLFIAVTSIVSLLQFHLDWYDQMRAADISLAKALAAALKAGPLFFFAVPLAIAVAFEVWSHTALREMLFARLLAYGCAIPVLALLFECFRVRYGAAPPDTGYFLAQGGSAVLVICYSSSIRLLALDIDQSQ